MLQCYLFGEIRLFIDGRPIPLPQTQKALRLLCYLLLHRDRSHPRSVLSAMMWPDRDESSARRCLSTTLWRLRRALTLPSQEVPLLRIQGNTIGINPQCTYWLDVAVFEEKCQSVLATPGRDLSQAQVESLRTATALYRGELMEGIYTEWCLVERERLASLHIQALTKLLAFHHHHGQTTEAIAYAQRILSIDPLRESTHRELMLLYHRAGDRAAALQQFERCRRSLAKELNIEPMAETWELYQEIRNDSSPRTSAREPLPDLPKPAQLKDPEVQHALAYLLDSKAQLDVATRQLQRAMDMVERLLAQRLSS